MFTSFERTEKVQRGIHKIIFEELDKSDKVNFTLEDMVALFPKDWSDEERLIGVELLDLAIRIDEELGCFRKK